MLRLFRYLKPYTLLIALTCLLLLVQALGNLALPLFLSQIIDVGIASQNISFILTIGIYMIITVIITSISGAFAMFTSAKVSMGFGRDLRRMMFKKATHFSLNEFNRLGTSSLITRTTNDVYQVQQLIVIGLRMMISAPLMAIGGTLLALSKSLRLSCILLISIPILSLLIFIIGKKTIPLYNAIQSKLDDVNLILRENLTGIRVIRAFSKTAYEEERFDHASKSLMTHSIKVNKLMALLMPSIMLILNMTAVAILWFGNLLVGSRALLVGDLIAFIQYVMQIMFSLVMLTMVFVLIPKAVASANRIQEALELQNSIVAPSQTPSPLSLKGCITFKNVYFSYPGSNQYALNGISFSVHPGETVAIIGGTGSGKTTLLNLITRFYEATSGEILIDGIRIQDFSLHDLHDKIGYVPQKAFLFKGSIKDNLAYGKASPSTKDLNKALSIAQANEFVSAMPKGVDSLITQGSTNISGGQKQRLAIARALIKNPEIYLFDDSFSALDFKTDSALRHALQSEVKDSAVIIVGQRITSIMHADTILVLEHGKLVGKGKHKDLLKNCKIYQEIAMSQLSKEELEKEANS